MRRLCSIALVSLALVTPVAAQDAKPDDAKALEKLQEEVEKLKKKLEELDKDQAPHPASKPAKPGEKKPADEAPEGETKAQALWKWVSENFHISLNLNNVYVGGDHAFVGNAAGLRGSYNTFTVAQFEIDIWTEFKFGVDFRVDIDTAEDDDGLGTVGQILYPDELEIEQGYIQFDLDKILGLAPLKFVFGKFNYPMGFEPIDAPGLWQVTRSNVANFLTPNNAVGAMAKFETKFIDAETYLVNGWNTNDDPDTEKTVGGRLTLKLFNMGKYHVVQVSPAITYGREPTGQHSGDQRTVFDLVVLLQPLKQLKIAFEFNQGHESKHVALGRGSSEWTGYQLSATLQVLPWMGVTLRGEYIDDHDGVQTGALTVGSQHHHLRSFTTALLFKVPLGNKVVEEFFINLEWRYDRSNQRLYTNHSPSTTGDEHHRSQFALQVYLYF